MRSHLQHTDPQGPASRPQKPYPLLPIRSRQTADSSSRTGVTADSCRTHAAVRPASSEIFEVRIFVTEAAPKCFTGANGCVGGGEICSSGFRVAFVAGDTCTQAQAKNVAWTLCEDGLKVAFRGFVSAIADGEVSLTLYDMYRDGLLHLGQSQRARSQSIDVRFVTVLLAIDANLGLLDSCVKVGERCIEQTQPIVDVTAADVE